MTVAELQTLLSSLDPSTLVVSSCFGQKLRTPKIDVVDMVTFEGESYGWWKNDKLKYEHAHTEQKVLRIQ